MTAPSLPTVLTTAGLASAAAVGAAGAAVGAAGAGAASVRAATTPETLLDRWQDFLAHDLVPLGRFALAVLVVAAVLGALARLLVVAVPAWPRLLRRARVVTLATALGGTSAFVLTLGTAAGPRRGTALVTGLLLGAAGIVLGAWWLATRLRLTVTVTARDGSDAAGSSAHITALLGDLGATPPRGLEVPRGSDVSGLGGALGDLPQGKLAQTALALLQQIVGSSPWHALVDVVDDDTLAVTVTRNGRQQGAAVVDRDALRVGDLRAYDDAARRVDLHRFAAAVVMTTLARAYPEDFRGLCGATDWRSLGLHYVATTDFQNDPAVQRRILAQALERDPGNWLAQLAYHNVSMRYTTDPMVLAAYRTWLTEVLEHRLTAPEHRSLALRARYTRVSVDVNIAFARAGVTFDGPAVRGVAFDEDAVRDVEDLAARLAEITPPPERGWRHRPDPFLPAAALAEDLRLCAAPLVRLVADRAAGGTGRARVALDGVEDASGLGDRQPDGCLPDHDQSSTSDGMPRSPKAYYTLACALATYCDRPSEFMIDRAVGALRLAVGTPSLRDWMWRDPQLQGLRSTRAFRVVFGAVPRTDLLGLGVVAPFADALRRAGLTTPDAILAVAVRDLREQTAATRAEAAALREVAALRASMPARLDPWAVEVLHELGARGIWSSATLARAAAGGTQKRALVGEVAGVVTDRVSPTQGSDGPNLRTLLARWVDDVVFRAIASGGSTVTDLPRPGAYPPRQASYGG